MKKLTLCLLGLLSVQSALATCERKSVELLVVGDSQSGATWSRSYFGNFLQSCLEDEFILFGRGGTTPAHWLGKGGMDQIETIQRDPRNAHLNLGSGEKVPLCKKRISSMFDTYQPRRILLEFGGNLIGQTDAVITNQIEKLMGTVQEKGISPENCSFLTPTYEMQVSTHRSVPTRNIQAVKKITQLITKAINGRCQLIDGLELMKDSKLLGQDLKLKRVLISGAGGCGGAAANDNVHVCGEAAKELAGKVCKIFNR